MTAYYQERAAEYDRFYGVPAFREDLERLEEWTTTHVRGRTVLEVAAGTGHWTKIASRVAKSVIATDLHAETLALAKRRRLGSQVSFVMADAFALPGFAMNFDVGMAHLWWSHVPRERRHEFLAGLAKHVRPNGTILMLDQRYGRSFSIPASRRDTRGNRYELRELASGKTFEVMKNYPSGVSLRADLERVGKHVRIMQLKYFWAVSADLR